MAALALAALACLAPAPACAGHYNITYSASIPANGQALPLLTMNSGPTPFYDYGYNYASGTTTLTVTAKAVWAPDGPGDAPPASQLFQEVFSAFGAGGGPPGDSVTVADGAGDPDVPSSWPYYSGYVEVEDTVQDLADGEHLWVGAGANISLPQVTMTVTFSGGAAGSLGLCYDVSTVNGGWAGPYYFHTGEYIEGNIAQQASSPWPNNTANDEPVPTDKPNGNNIFQYVESIAPLGGSVGSITPVWIWKGPTLPNNTAPPSFIINVMTDAFAHDETGNAPAFTVNDGQENTVIQNTGSVDFVQDTDICGTRVVPDSAGPANGWWALGPTIDMESISDGDANYSPYDMYTYVGMSATIAHYGGG